jgi:hypothetical protein
MPHEITVRRRGSTPERRAVEAPLTAGGSRGDGVFVEGLAAGALRLIPVAAGVVVEASVPGARVGGHPAPPGERRLLRPGHQAEMQGVVLALEAGPAPAGDGTRCAAAEILRGAAAGEVVTGPALVVLSGSAAGARHPLGAEATLGRGRAATIRLLDPRASRLHARLRVGAGGVTVEDLGSKNGVRLDGVRIEARRPYPLTEGQELSIGDTLLAIDVSPHLPAREARSLRGAPRATSAPLAALRLATVALLALSAAALALASS